MCQDVVFNYKKVADKLSTACLKAQRNSNEVTLVAVSKWHPAEKIVALAKAYGAQLICGESYAQEALEKQESIQALCAADAALIQPEWHFIGHIQSRKAKDVMGRFTLLHSVDSVKLAKALDKAWHTLAEGSAIPLAPQAILLQVNVGEEAQKSGIAPKDLEAVCKEIMQCQGLQILGLMCLPPACEKAEEVRPWFALLRQMQQQLRRSTGLALPHLSMGMSHDFEVAIEEGATLVRVGTDIFGERQA